MMILYLCLPLQLLTLMFSPHFSLSFTAIMSDSGVPSSLVNGPQNGFSMKHDVGARTDSHEQEAVYDIMRATGNDWATDIPDVCRGRWHGIECMPDKDNVYHVVSLSFGALSDDTAFPTCDPTRSYLSRSVTKLPHLKTLFFYRCFSYNPQPIPTFLGTLGRTLQTLVLRENGHVGPIPDEVGNLTRLRVLDLHNNHLNGSIPLSLNRITGLRSLDLSGNKLTGPIPGLTFPSLNILDLGQNLLTGPIPSTLGACLPLIKLDLSRNHLNGMIPEKINGLKSLMLMDLSYNNLSGPLPKSLKSLSSLQALILKGNPMGPGPTTIPNNGFTGMTELMTLVLSNMNLHGPIPESLGQLPNLRVVHLDGNSLNGSVPKSFKDLKNLSELRLNDNKLSGSVPFSREMVWRMKKKLRLHNNSGLCYADKSGFRDSEDSTFNQYGIKLCDEDRSNNNGGSEGSLGTIVQHLSVTRQKSEPTTTNVVSSSSDAPVLVVAVTVTRLLSLTSLLLFTLILL
ncbi:hypothetical protein QN277_024330 [Acacia crassicarpa]|uniref:Disease resistance R13L4/SHOC-2-like LRR domain-containing protein n=2 Tax=Acacia crassicarpa TaxID=499986 RepID=A0AAE1MK16_9FABA|nr:hypothetical protein QN277_024330 [Acacia crassicarpa]